MYQALTFLHSLMRWLVLLSLLYAIYRAWQGYKRNAVFTKTDNAVRHWTATIAHTQLMIGMVLYSQSPLIRYMLRAMGEALHYTDVLFFGFIHVALMITAIIIITIGSANAKRKQADKEKFRTMLVWFSVALFIILIAIPWPFSPLVARPYFR